MGKRLRKRRHKNDHNCSHGSTETQVNNNIRQLMQWSLQNYVKIKGITTKYFKNTGQGVKTTQFIDRDTIIISVPRNFLITFETVWYSHLSLFLKSKHTFMTSKDLFILFLIAERRKKEKSKFFHYIKSVPMAYTTLSYVLNEELHLLPTFVLEETKKQNTNISKHLTRIQKSLKSIEDSELSRLFLCDAILKSEVLWAWNVLNTRSVYFGPSLLKCKDKVNVLEIDFALAPLLDMLNHSCHAEVQAGFNTVTNCYEIRSFNTYKPGDQIFINYGPHSNRTLLFEYGFILPNNIHAMVPISEQLMFRYFSNKNESETKLQLKRNIMKNCGVCIGNVCCTSTGFDWSFVTAAHLLSLKDNAAKTFSLPERCSELCIIADGCKELLENLIYDYEAWIRNVTDFSSPSEVLSGVRSLLESETEILKKTFKNFSMDCSIIC